MFDCGYQKTVSGPVPKEYLKFIAKDPPFVAPLPDNKAMFVKKCMVPALSRKILPAPSSILMGNTKRNGLKHSVFTASGDVYVGEWRDDKKTGHGSYKSRRLGKLMYEGEWNAGLPDGYGVLCHMAEHNRYNIHHEGFWKQGKFQGSGRHFYKDGSYYEGGWKNGKKEEFGQLWYANGTYYEGQFFNNKRHGRGMFVYTNGDRYIGTWTANQKHGFGAYYHLTTGQVQMGHWKFDSCISSWMMDLKYRQTVPNPTPFPIPAKSRPAKHYKIVNSWALPPESKNTASQTGE